MIRLENRFAIEEVKFSERSQFLETSPVAEAGWRARRRCCNARFIFLAGHRYALRARIKLARYLWQGKSFNVSEGHLKIPNLRKNLGLGFYLRELIFLFTFRLEGSEDARTQPYFCDRKFT